MSELSIIHTTNRNVWELDLSDTLSYTIIIYNITDEIVENINIDINIDKNTYYVDGSFTLNGLKKEFNPNSSLFVPKINPKENILMTLDIKFLDCKIPSEINAYTSVNYSKVDFSKSLTYDDGSWCSPKTYIEKTNESELDINVKSKIISTPIIFKNVSVQQSILQENTKLGDVLDYQFVVRNNGSIDVDDAVLNLSSNGELDLVLGSVNINTIDILESNFKNGIYIGCIHPNETILIKFKAKVRKINTLSALSSKGILTFYYRNSSTFHPFPKQINSNEYVLDIAPDIDKTINISKIIQIPSFAPKVSQIVDVFSYGVEVTSKDIVTSIKGYSLEQNKSGGKNIFLSGYISGRITYSANTEFNNYDTKAYPLEYEVPFKTEILMPDNFSDYIESIVDVEFVDATMLDNDRVYINAVLNIALINN